MFEQPRFYREGWIPVAAGFAWLFKAPDFWIGGWLISLVVGAVLLASGVGVLLFPGDRRIHHYAALCGALGSVFGLGPLFHLDLAGALLLTGTSFASFLAAGHLSVKQTPHAEEVPEPIPSLGLAAKVAVDDAVCATMQMGVALPRGDEFARIQREVEEARALFDARGYLEKPALYHREPPALEAPVLRPARLRSIAYEHLSFESGYEPAAEEPGRDRWLSRRANRTAHAWVVRHERESSPWIVCVHGYQMGMPAIDFLPFDPRWLVQRLGFHLAIPILPLHGPRRRAWRSGDGFLSGDLLDTVHAEAQAMWDLRRLLRFIRAQGAPSVSVYGLSLGGYNAALLASLEADLGCVIAGVPAADFARLSFWHGPPLHLRYAEHLGLSPDQTAEVLSVVSPLELPPQVPRERRFLFAGVGDRIVPPENARDLWRHWDRPQIVWFQGGHLTFRADPAVRAMVDGALRAAAAGRLGPGAAPDTVS